MKLEKELTYNQPNVDIDIGFHESIKIADENLKLLRNLDKNAQAKYPILGGCFSTSVADGKVFYQVVEEDGEEISDEVRSWFSELNIEIDE